MKQYDLVAENPESTIVAEYIEEYRRATAYQSAFLTGCGISCKLLFYP
jgi:hypothetical protein